MKGIKLLTAAQLDNYSNRKDKSVTIRFITQEKMPSEIMDIHAMIGTFGYLYFKPEETLTKKEIEEIDALDTDLYDNPKTKSQRLRGVIWKLWEQDNKGFTEFKDFYSNKMEKIITHLKDQII